MLPHRHIGRPGSEQWLGLVDALYAIAMTLMALDIPHTVRDYVGANSTRLGFSVLLGGVYSVGTYLIVFLIIYEVWCFHRSILWLAQGEKSRRQSLITCTILSIICLGPAWCSFIVEHYTEAMALNRVVTAQTTIFSAFGWLLAGLAFWLIYCLGASSKGYQDEPALQVAARSARNRSLVFCCFFLIYIVHSFMDFTPFMPPNLMLLTYVVIGFNEDRLRGLLIQPFARFVKRRPPSSR